MNERQSAVAQLLLEESQEFFRTLGELPAAERNYNVREAMMLMKAVIFRQTEKPKGVLDWMPED